MQTFETNIEQKLLVLAIIFFPIIFCPVTIPIFGKVFSGLFILLGVARFTYKVIAGKERLVRFELFSLYYLLVYFLWHCICSIVGIQEYAYYHLINLEQLDKLRILLQELRGIGIIITDITAIKSWLFLRFIKDCVINLFLTYGISVWVFHIFIGIKNDLKRKKIILKVVSDAVIVLSVALIVYSFFEIGYLRGDKFCAEIIMEINPFLYKAQQDYGWYPPLIWANQLRSLFAEPSYFGIFSIFIFPILFYKMLIYKTSFNFVIYASLVAMLFMTQSRTAVFLFLILLFFLLLYSCSLYCNYFKRVAVIFLISIISFGVSVYAIAGFKPIPDYNPHVSEMNKDFGTMNYIRNNVMSVIGEQRSNSARYAVLRATIITALENPVFGVGMETGADVEARFTSRDLENNEIKNRWLRYMHKEGPMKVTIPCLNQLLHEMARFGIPGLFIYLLPVFYIFYKLQKNFNKNLSLESACISIAYIGSLASFFSNIAFLPYYILTGLMLVLLYDETGETTNEKIRSKGNLA